MPSGQYKDTCQFFISRCTFYNDFKPLGGGSCLLLHNVLSFDFSCLIIENSENYFRIRMYLSYLFKFFSIENQLNEFVNSFHLLPFAGIFCTIQVGLRVSVTKVGRVLV